MVDRKIQMTLIQLDSYREWTSQLGLDREASIQIIQSSLYSDIQKMFAQLGGLVFPLRLDNMIAISNGVSVENHREFQLNIAEKYPFTVSMGVGYGCTAYEAQAEASRSLLKLKRSVSNSKMLLVAADRVMEENIVQVAHFDIVNSTRLITDRNSAFDAYGLIQHIYRHLARSLKRKGGIIFYLGGDNYAAPSNGMVEADYLDSIKSVENEIGVMLRVGVGVDVTARLAMKQANKALENMRLGLAEGPVLFGNAKLVQCYSGIGK